MNRILLAETLNIVDDIYKPKKTKFLHSKGIILWVDVEFTKDDFTVWQKMLNSGVDGMQTNYPEQMVQYLDKKGMR